MYQKQKKPGLVWQIDALVNKVNGDPESMSQRIQCE